MDNIIGLVIGVMVTVIMLYAVVLPTINTSINGAAGVAANLTSAQYTLTLVIPTLLITTVVVFIARGMLG